MTPALHSVQPDDASSLPEHACLYVLRAVQALHTMGYQRVRIAPGLSPSGATWRCTITPAANVLRRHGAIEAGSSPDSACYSSVMGRQYFGWHDAVSDSPGELAVKILERFPSLTAAGAGRDWAYAGWYAEMLGHAARGALPTAYGDYIDGDADLPWLPTTAGQQSGLPLPPPGEASAPADGADGGLMPPNKMLGMVEFLVRQFLTEYHDLADSFYNEASLQHELALYLRRTALQGWRLHIERPASWFRREATGLTKREIDLAVVDTGTGAVVAIELKCPRQGQHPEQMFKACQDIQFLEELNAAGFSGGVFVMHVRDPLFYQAGSHTGIYAHFRTGLPICGQIRKPTGSQNAIARLVGSYTPAWARGTGADRYWVQAVPPL